ncbi:MAG: PEGA domain-containing protein [Myxococcota bacterium]
MIGSTMAGVPPGRSGTVGLGILTAVLVFGVTLALLMTFANPGARTPGATTPSAGAVVLPMSPASPGLAATPGVVIPMAEPVAREALPAATHGELVIKAEPVGAEVLVDGRSMGNAPFDGVLEAGMHRVELNATGYEPWNSEVEVVLGERQMLNIVLPRAEATTAETSRRRNKRPSSNKSSKKKSSDKSAGASSEDDAVEKPAAVEPPRKLDRGDSKFKKLDGGGSGSKFKKLGEGGKIGGVKKLGG